MTKDERVEILIDRIADDLKGLQDLTGNKHISVFVIDDFFHLIAYTDDDKIAFSETRSENE